MHVEKRIIYPPAGNQGGWLSVPSPEGARAMNPTGGTGIPTPGTAGVRVDLARGGTREPVTTIAIAETSQIASADIYPGGRITPQNRFRISPGVPLVHEMPDDFFVVCAPRAFNLPTFGGLSLTSMYWGGQMMSGGDAGTRYLWPPIELNIYRGQVASPVAFVKRAPLCAEWAGRTTQVANGGAACLVCLDERHSFDVLATAYNFLGATTSATITLYADDASMQLDGTMSVIGEQTLATVSGAAPVLQKEYQGKGWGSIYVLVQPNNPGTGTCDFQVRVSATDDD